MNNSTCPEGKLEPTYWDRPDQYEYFKDLNILLSSTAPRSTSSASPSSGSGGGGSSNRSAVIGGAVGGTLGFLAIVGLVVFLLWRRKRAARAKDPSGSSMEENKPAGELASPISAGTGTPTCPCPCPCPCQRRQATEPTDATQLHRHIPGTSTAPLHPNKPGLTTAPKSPAKTPKIPPEARSPNCTPSRHWLASPNCQALLPPRNSPLLTSRPSHRRPDSVATWRRHPLWVMCLSQGPAPRSTRTEESIFWATKASAIFEFHVVAGIVYSRLSFRYQAPILRILQPSAEKSKRYLVSLERCLGT